MKMFPWTTRSTSENDENPDPAFWSPPKWPGKDDELRTLVLPDADPFLLSARPAAGINPEVTALLAEKEFEAAVLQNMQMLEANS